MTESTSPADRYRRLLAWYPRDHREQHGEEMLDVLLAGAGERARPTRRETVDLLRGALRLHLRRVVGADGGIDHQDVFAIVSLLGPIAVLAGTAQTLDWLRGIPRSGSPVSWERAVPNAPVWGIYFWQSVALDIGWLLLGAVVAAALSPRWCSWDREACRTACPARRPAPDGGQAMVNWGIRAMIWRSWRSSEMPWKSWRGV